MYLFTAKSSPIALLLAGFLLFTPILTQAQCQLTPLDSRGCVPFPASFNLKLPAGKTATNFDWDFGDGSTSDERNPTRVYNQRGTYTAKVTVTFSDGSTCTATSSQNIIVYGNPDAEIDLPQAMDLCPDQRFVQVRENATRSADNSPIVNYLWDFDDGTIDRLKNPFHAFPGSGTYNVVLEVQDENGCKDTALKKFTLNIYEPLDPDFSRNGRDSCPVTKVNFNNITDSNGLKINKVRWYLGDGTAVSATKQDANWGDVWSGVSHTYAKEGEFTPALVVENIHGCKDSLPKFKISNVRFFFNLNIQPNKPVCYDALKGGNAFSFRLDPINDANSVTWHWGNGERGYDGFIRTNFYDAPGNYSIKVAVRVKGCTRDTTICDAVQIMGPIARIERFPDDLHDTLPFYPFHEGFPQAADTCAAPYPEYYTIDTVTRKVPITQYCNADTISQVAIGERLTCNGYEPIFEYTLQPTSTPDGVKTDYIRQKHTWHPDTPIVEAIFSPYTGNNTPGNIHDTDIYAPACTAPHTVKFTNNSIKHRLYDAVDNYPWGLPDTCRNPSYPWATDSLDYFWDFGDKFAKACTSSTVNPDKRCAYSTEKMPEHTFIEDSCYKVMLHVSDPVTGCKDQDSIQIIVEAPDASGVALIGMPCVGASQRLDLSNVHPKCGPQRYWVIHDSADLTKTVRCKGELVYERTWETRHYKNEGTPVFNYDSIGWKTMGFVAKSGNCFDTVWKHNYKYIYNNNTSFTASKSQLCPGDSFFVTVTDTTEQGIATVWYDFNYRYGQFDFNQLIESDTITYTNWNRGDTILPVTSSLFDTTSGVIDDTAINHLSEKVWFKFDKPGHILVRGNAEHRFGCLEEQVMDIAIGHHADFETEFQEYCLGDSILFEDEVRYFMPFIQSQTGNGLNPVDYWRDPYQNRIDTPSQLEAIQWDFDADSVIDHVGPAPVFVYDTPGIYTVRMFTRDTAACEWQMIEKKNYIKISSVQADFSVVNDDTLRFCAPQFFEYQDESQVYQGHSKDRDTIIRWTWDWGEGNQTTLGQLNNGKVGRVYRNNGRFNVHLRTELRTYTLQQSPNCFDTTSNWMYIRGPRTKFSIIGDTVGCAPFATQVLDQTERASVWEWRLGDGRSKTSSGQDSVFLFYPDPGTYCISLAAGDTIRDLNDSVIYCIEEYPANNANCPYKVRVLPKDPIALDYDSILCVNETGSFSFPNADSAYSQFSLQFAEDGPWESVDSHTTYAYKQAGNYQLQYTGQSLCPDTAQSPISIIDIMANFALDSQQMDTPNFTFTNLSRNGERYEWYINEDDVRYFDNETSLSYAFNQTGQQQICLVAFNSRECPDTFCRWVEITTNIFIPNVFSPGSDGFNDQYNIPIKGEIAYDLTIFTRWGEKVFESQNADNDWNGRRFNTGPACLPGTYYYVFNYQLIGESAKTATGTITLLH